MKEKRNCGMYPVYPTPMMPGIDQQMPFPVPYQTQNMPYYNQNYSQSTNTSNELSSIESRINNLENRVNKLEQMTSNYPTTNSTKYTDSNYYMV